MLKSLKEKQVLACSSSKARKASQKADLGPSKEYPNLLRPYIKMLFLSKEKTKIGSCIFLTRHPNATKKGAKCIMSWRRIKIACQKRPFWGFFICNLTLSGMHLTRLWPLQSCMQIWATLINRRWSALGVKSGYLCSHFQLFFNRIIEYKHTAEYKKHL